MANLLADIGRSNLFQVGQALFRDASLIDRQRWEEENRKRLVDIEVAQETRKQQEYNDKIKRENMFYPATYFGIDPANPSDVHRQLIKDMTDAGLVEKNESGMIGIRAKNAPLVNDFYSKAPDRLKGIVFLQMQEIAAQMPKAKTEEEKMALVQAYNEAEDRIRQINDLAKGEQVQIVNTSEGGTSTILQGGKPKYQIQGSPKNKGKMIPVYDPSSPTGYSYGNPDTGELSDLSAPPPTSSGTEDRLKEIERHNREMERLAAEKQKAGENLSFADKEALRSMGKQLPKTKQAAELAAKNIQKIDRMLTLIDSGSGGVSGDLLAKINRVTDALRATPPEDAKYNTLRAELRGFAGQLRQQLGMLGSTSDRDVQIMFEAAGGASPAESQRAILEGYRQGYEQDVHNYNSDAETYSTYSPAAKSMFRTIDIPTRKSSGTTPSSGSGKLSKEEAVDYLRRAGGDKNKAREMARKDGRSF